MTQPNPSRDVDATRGSFVGTVCSLGVWVGGVILFIISFSVCIEVLVRKFFNTSIQGIDELAGYGMAISFAWAMPYAIRTNAHIRVDILYTALPRILQNLSDIAAAIFFVIYLSVLGYFSVLLFLASYDEMTLSGSVLAIPLFAPQALWSLGLLAGVVVLIAGIPLTLRAMISRQNQSGDEASR